MASEDNRKENDIDIAVASEDESEEVMEIKPSKTEYRIYKEKFD